MASDLGPVIGGIAPMKPIEKPLLLEDGQCAVQRAAWIVLGFALSFVGATVIALLWVLYVFFPWPALAQHHHHQHHAFYQGWINIDGQGCCNDRDCADLASGDERESGGVLEVRVEGEWCPVEPRHYLKKGNVPNAAVSHACVIPQKVQPALGACARFICYQPQPRM